MSGFTLYAEENKTLGGPVVTRFFIVHRDYGYLAGQLDMLSKKMVVDGTRWLGDGTYAAPFVTLEQAKAKVDSIIKYPHNTVYGKANIFIEERCDGHLIDEIELS